MLRSLVGSEMCIRDRSTQSTGPDSCGMGQALGCECSDARGQSPSQARTPETDHVDSVCIESWRCVDAVAHPTERRRLMMHFQVLARSVTSAACLTGGHPVTAARQRALADAGGMKDQDPGIRGLASDSCAASILEYANQISSQWKIPIEFAAYFCTRDVLDRELDRLALGRETSRRTVPEGTGRRQTAALVISLASAGWDTRAAVAIAGPDRLAARTIRRCAEEALRSHVWQISATEEERMLVLAARHAVRMLHVVSSLDPVYCYGRLAGADEILPVLAHALRPLACEQAIHRARVLRVGIHALQQHCEFNDRVPYAVTVLEVALSAACAWETGALEEEAVSRKRKPTTIRCDRPEGQIAEGDGASWIRFKERARTCLAACPTGTSPRATDDDPRTAITLGEMEPVTGWTIDWAEEEGGREGTESPDNDKPAQLRTTSSNYIIDESRNVIGDH
eukprot:TRINITY_DN13441_c0_g3_i7.p1 TRINITY_DN13441_c0_g3~~TRINITY_DN13441_c0_g3_i7.p1  ORF type:complete len:503 (+),score=83.16 TRINITY_DN13441_c0_g3_i7:150-1511(+)